MWDFDVFALRMPPTRSDLEAWVRQEAMAAEWAARENRRRLRLRWSEGRDSRSQGGLPVRTMKAEELTSADPAVRHADSFFSRGQTGLARVQCQKKAVNIGLAIWSICLAIGWVLVNLRGLLPVC